MFYKYIALLPVVASIIISGCQSQPSKLTASGDSVILELLSLSHLPESTKIDVSLVNADNTVKNDIIKGVSYFPFKYKLPVLEGKQPIKMEVKVSVEGETVLAGEHALSFPGDNRIVLKPVRLASLANTYWRAEDLSGRGIPPTVETTLAFNGESKLSGNAGCNLYYGNYKSSSVFIEIEKAKLTRQLCSSPVMYHENRYLVLLTDAERFSIDEDGNLSIYLSHREKPLKFTPSTHQEARLSMNMK